MRVLTYLLLALFAVAVIALSVANRGPVTVTAYPDVTAYGLPPSPTFTLPIFLLCLGFGALGFVIGVAREYLREGRVRAKAAESRQQIGELKREVDVMKRKAKVDEDDEIIMLTSR